MVGNSIVFFYLLIAIMNPETGSSTECNAVVATSIGRKSPHPAKSQERTFCKAFKVSGRERGISGNHYHARSIHNIGNITGHIIIIHLFPYRSTVYSQDASKIGLNQHPDGISSLVLSSSSGHPGRFFTGFCLGFCLGFCPPAPIPQ